MGMSHVPDIQTTYLAWDLHVHALRRALSSWLLCMRAGLSYGVFAFA